MAPRSNWRLVWHPPINVRSDVAWSVRIVGAIVVVFGLALLIGAALAALPFVAGAVVAFVVVALLIALMVLELPRLRARLPR